MKILTFGRDGQVGRALRRRLDAQADTESFAFGRTDLDLSDAAAVGACIDRIKPDVVINAAAYTQVDQAEDDAAMAFSVNAAAPAAMARACAALDACLVHYSTDYVFDGRGTRPYIETDATRPLGVYGESKLAGEVAVGDQCPRHVILRTSWVYDEDGRNFVTTMRRLGGERDSLSVVDDQSGCPTYAGDLAEQTLAIVNHVRAARPPRDDACYGTYHLAGNGDTTWCGFAAAIFERLSGCDPQLTPITTSEFPTKAPRPAYSVLDCRKAADVFGVRMPHWQDALSRCLRNC